MEPDENQFKMMTLLTAQNYDLCIFLLICVNPTESPTGTLPETHLHLHENALCLNHYNFMIHTIDPYFIHAHVPH